MGSFWSELKKRRVIRAAVVYVLVAWVIMQIADVVAPQLLLPDWVASLVTFLLILGFPISLVLAWAYDLTPDGIVLTPPSNADEEPESTTAAANSIAVLPFRNMSPDPDKEFFSDGITDEILSVLAREGALKVAARTSCFYFKGRDESIKSIGKELGVAKILEGSVRSEGERIRITAQLVDAAEGYQVWSQTFDRDVNSLLDVQDEIARAIVATTQGGTTAGTNPRPTASDTAYQHYLRGRYLWQRREAASINEGIALLREAIALDPDFAGAYATLAAAYHKLPLYDPEADNAACQSLAEAAAREAIAKDPDLVDAHSTLASILAVSHRYDDAEAAFKRALELGPEDSAAQHWYAVFLLNTGRLDEALEHIRIAEALDPLNGAIAGTYGNITFALSQTDEAIAKYETALQLGWADAANAFLGAVFIHLGDKDRAEAHLRRGRLGAEPIPEALIEKIVRTSSEDAASWATLGDDLAERVSSGEVSPDLAFRLAALLGHQQAFDLAGDTVSADAFGLLWLPGATALREDPRFNELAARVGLTSA